RERQRNGLSRRSVPHEGQGSVGAAMWNLPQHTYEELREVVIDILLRREGVMYPPDQWASLSSGLAEVIGRREAKPGQLTSRHDQPRLHPQDVELIRDVFWDLFRQGFITLG